MTSERALQMTNHREDCDIAADGRVNTTIDAEKLGQVVIYVKSTEIDVSSPLYCESGINGMFYATTDSRCGMCRAYC